MEVQSCGEHTLTVSRRPCAFPRAETCLWFLLHKNEQPLVAGCFLSLPIDESRVNVHRKRQEDFSISHASLHCKTLGGYITSIEASNIGRASNIKSNHVSSRNVLRVSSPSLDDAKDRSHIWLGEVAPSIAFVSVLA